MNRSQSHGWSLLMASARMDRVMTLRLSGHAAKRVWAVWSVAMMLLARFCLSVAFWGVQDRLLLLKCALLVGWRTVAE